MRNDIEQLAIVNIKFTRRELDIIACVLNGRGAKIIASFLSIAPKTVETHLQHIMQKVGCNSREGIINFIEKAPEFPLIKRHYLDLLVQAAFERWLQNVSLLITKKDISCLIVFYHPQEEKTFLIDRLRAHLQSVGIEVFIDRRKVNPTVSSLIKDLESQRGNSSRLSEGSLSHIGSSVSLETARSLPVDSLDVGTVVFLLPEKAINDIPSEICDVVCFYSGEKKDYYLTILEILKKIVPDVEIDVLASDFQKQQAAIYAGLLERGASIIQESDECPSFPVLGIKNKKSLLAGAFMVSVVWSGFFYLKNYQAQEIVRSDFIIPSKSVFLKRVRLMSQIEKKLRSNDDIQKVVLIGMGGAGKTTLARQYLSLQKPPIMWEINAETKETLVNSFFDLAYTLAKSSQQKDELNFIQKIPDYREKEKQLIFFVKKSLKETSNWFLLFDNVETLSGLQSYLPSDSNTWGRGKVIITTRNNNIKNSGDIRPEYCVHLDALEEQEKLTLLCKILYNCEPSHLTNYEQTSASLFLKNIPSYPLDVSMAAYYLKNTQLHFDQYLERVNKFSEVFDDTQKTFLQEMGDYSKTRYGIITSTLKKLIKENPDFKKLLLFVCLLESQDIPQYLIKHAKNDVVADKFIYSLRKDSLISARSESARSFSIHRYIQIIGLDFLMDLLNEDEKKIILDDIVSVFETFNKQHSKEECEIVISLIPHLESIINFLPTLKLSKELRGKYESQLKMILGYAHDQCTNNFAKAIECFSSVLKNNEGKNYISRKTLAIMLEDLGYDSVELGDIKHGLSYLEESINLCKQIDDQESLAWMVRGLINTGWAYRKENHFTTAEKYFGKALKESEAILDALIKKEVRARIYMGLAALHTKTYIHKAEAYKAVVYMKQALEELNASQYFHLSLGNFKKEIPDTLITGRWRLCQIYCNLNRYEEATCELEEAKYLLQNSTDCRYGIAIKALMSLEEGRIALRKGKINEAEKILTGALKTFSNTGDADAWETNVYRAEALIRLNKLEAAYADCEAVFQIKKREKSNASNLIYFTNYYHAAFIAYKQGNLKKSLEHFDDFFKGMKYFCEFFLTKEEFITLKNKDVFKDIEIYEDTTDEYTKQLLVRSAEIYTAIYGETHPFVLDYIAKHN